MRKYRSRKVDCLPVVIIERLKLREITVKRWDIFRANTPEGTNFKNLACKTKQVQYYTYQGLVFSETYGPWPNPVDSHLVVVLVVQHQ